MVNRATEPGVLAAPASGWAGAGLGGARVSRRAFLLECAALAAAAGLATACVAPASPPEPPGATQPSVAPEPAAPPGRSTATQPATAAASLTQPEPRGRLVYGWHTTIAPTWLDPQENPPQVTPYNFQYALHDAMVKHLPGQEFSPSLAESYEIPPDFKSATFKLRPGVKFHDGNPVSSEDVKFTYEHYRGASAAVLKQKTERVETPDDRTVRFVFREPFLDFLMVYGSPASGAGWIVPKAYYEKVGKDGFKQHPIGAGPYRFVRQVAGNEIELEAVADYWRKSPSVKTIVMRAVPEAAARVALLRTGEADVANVIPGELLAAVNGDPKLRAVALKSGPGWLELTSYDRPDSPLRDVRVREAVSLAIDRQAISDAEMGGQGAIEGNWIPEDWPGALRRPAPATDLPRARLLMAQAGYSSGFEVSSLTAWPPYVSWGERIVTQLRAIGIRTQLNVMERAAFYERLAPGPNRLAGLILVLSGAPGDAAARLREHAVCNGSFSGLCQPEVDERMQRYEASVDPLTRTQLLTEIQAFLLDNYLLVPTVRLAMVHCLGARITNAAEEVMGSIPQYVFIGPYEDIRLTG